MSRFTILTAATLGAALLSGPVLGAGYDSGGATGYTDYAEVVHFEPIYRKVQVSTPREECWDQQVTRRHAGSYQSHGQSYTSTILGGIVGGVIGHQFGKGTGNTLMTAAGALLGGSVGNDAGRQHRYHDRGQTYTTTERRCDTVQSYRQEERLDGYHVEYRYQGRLYTTQMHEPPGERIAVRVEVAPQ